MSKLLAHGGITLIFTLVIGNLLIVGSDWTAHVLFAADILRGDIAIVHFGFHLLLIVLSLGQAAFLPLAAWVVGVASANLLFYALTRYYQGRLGLAFAAFAAAPILVFTPNNQYFGYIGFHSVHSPTMDLLKPLALLLFMALLRWLTAGRGGILVVALCIGTAFVKPNLALSLLPALVALSAWWYWKRRCFNRAALISGGVLALTLAGQYVIQFALIDGQDGGIVLAPLQSLMQYEPDALALFGKALLSAAFPICVVLVYGVRRSLALQLAWLVFLFGAAQMYLLTETGSRSEHGNFWWGAQIGLLLLFIESLRYFVQYQQRAAWWKAYLVRFVLVLHAASGAAFLLLRMIMPGQGALW